MKIIDKSKVAKQLAEEANITSKDAARALELLSNLALSKNNISLSCFRPSRRREITPSPLSILKWLNGGIVSKPNQGYGRRLLKKEPRRSITKSENSKDNMRASDSEIRIKK